MEEKPLNKDSKRKFYLDKARTKKAHEAADKINAYPENVPIYYYGGHGTDVCDPVKNKPIIDIVPEGCIYITLTECGDLSYYNKNLEELFKDNSEESRQILRYPYLYENLLKLSKVSGIPMNRFHIHYPGMKYVVSNFDPIALFDSDSSLAMSISGLSEKSLMEKKANNLKYEGIIKKTHGFSSIFGGKLTKTVLIDLKNKIIPTSPDKIHMKRVLEDTDSKKILDEMFPEKENLDYSEGDKFFSKVFLVLSRIQIVNKFSASVFPTSAEVEEIIQNNFGNKQFFDQNQIKQIVGFILEKINKKSRPDLYRNSYLETTNRSLMTKFPGIHYNITCRSVLPSCLPLATTHRRNSFNRETIRRDVLIERKPEQLYYYNLSKLRDTQSIESFKEFLEKYKEKVQSLNAKQKIELLKETTEKMDPITDPVMEEIFTLMFPLKESYTPQEVLDNLEKDNNYKYDLRKENLYLDIIFEDRLEYYIQHLDKEHIEFLTKKEKTFYLNELKHTNAVYFSIQKEKLTKYLDDAFSDKTMFGPNYGSVISRINSIIDRDYPKAKNNRNLERTKQIALYNNLLGFKKTLEKLNDFEKNQLIKHLTDINILKSTNEPIISKKIRYVIWPEKYRNPMAGGGTRRKVRSRIYNKTRKN